MPAVRVHDEHFAFELSANFTAPSPDRAVWLTSFIEYQQVAHPGMDLASGYALQTQTKMGGTSVRRLAALFLPALLLLAFNAGSASALTCINASVLVIAFGAQCPDEYQPVRDDDDFDWEAYAELPPLGPDENIIVCTNITCTGPNDPPWYLYVTTTAVPEPATAGMFGLGALALAVAYRKRRTRK